MELGRGIQSTAMCLLPIGTGVSSTGSNKEEEEEDDEEEEEVEGRKIDGRALTASMRGVRSRSKDPADPELASSEGMQSVEALTEVELELEDEVEVEVDAVPLLELKTERNADFDTGE